MVGMFQASFVDALRERNVGEQLRKGDDGPHRRQLFVSENIVGKRIQNGDDRLKLRLRCIGRLAGLDYGLESRYRRAQDVSDQRGRDLTKFGITGSEVLLESLQNHRYE